MDGFFYIGSQMFITIIKKVFFITALICFIAPVSMAEEKNFSDHVDQDGNIQLPDSFRLSLRHIGAWYVPDGGASGFHDVFTEASAIEHFQKNQSFPDGATIVKELRGAIHGDFTTGKNVAYSETQVKQWFVMIKDGEGRFEDNKNWGDGWGWALFKTDQIGNQSSDYKTDCLGCHIPAKETDWIYTQAYPILSE